MSFRNEYVMSDDWHDRLLDASKPVPYIVIGGGPRDPQESANSVWRAMADDMGFIWDTVRPVTGKSDLYFSAVMRTAPVITTDTDVGIPLVIDMLIAIDTTDYTPVDTSSSPEFNGGGGEFGGGGASGSWDSSSDSDSGGGSSD